MNRPRFRPAATASVLASLLVVGLVIFLATRADAEPGTRNSTNDGGAWVVNRSEAYIGHVNRLVGDLSYAARAELEPGDQFDVHQPDGTIVVHNRTKAELIVVDQRSRRRQNAIALPGDAAVERFEGGVAITSAQLQTVWRLAFDDLLNSEVLSDVQPVVVNEEQSIVTSVRQDGALAVAAADGTLSIHPFPAPSATSEAVEKDLGVRPDLITWDGESVVVAAADLVVVVHPDREENAEIPVEREYVAISQPSGKEPVAKVALITESGDVDLIDTTGEETSTAPMGSLSGRPGARPLFHGGCLYAAGGSATVLQASCPAPPEIQEFDDGQNSLIRQEVWGQSWARLESRQDTGENEISLRLVNGWVWLTLVQNGRVALADGLAPPRLIDDWGAVLPKVEDPTPDDPEDPEGPAEGTAVDYVFNPDDPDALIIDDDKFDDDGVNEPPQVEPDPGIQSHVDRPVVVDVLANDSDPDGDVLLVDSVETSSPDSAVIERTADGRAVQVTPEPGFVGTIEFQYTVSDGRGAFGTTTGDVTFVERTGDPNSPPATAPDFGTVTAGRNLIINVLDNDLDPDGDTLVLDSITTDNGNVRFDASGQVIFTPDSTSETGRVSLPYVVSDDFGLTAEGSLIVDIRLPGSNQPPDARHDGAVTVVEQPVGINILQNDTDPDGDALFVSQRPELKSPEGAEHNVWDSPDGEFTFEADNPGTYIFEYSASDGATSNPAQIRIEVTEPGSNQDPVAVRDNLIIPAGERRIVYVLTNDGDPDGDVVGIVDLDVDPASGLRVEEFEGIGFVVEALPDAPQRTSFRYSISDGQSQPIGTVVMVSIAPAATINQAPLARPDVHEIRGGQSASIPVLINDVDPEGGALRVVEVSNPDQASVSIGPEGQSVTVRVNEGVETSFNVAYDVADEEGNRSSSLLRVQIVQEGLANRNPIARPDVARTPHNTAAVIPARLNDSDPDGDSIVLESIVQQPTGGVATIESDTGEIRYQPRPNFSGTDRFQYSVIDQFGARTIGDVLVGVMPEQSQNADPIAIDDSMQTSANGEVIEIPVLGNDRDPDQDPLTVVSVGVPSVGSAEVHESGRTVEYVPPIDLPEAAPVTFPYTVSDGRGGQSTATVTVLVERTPNAQDDGPIAVDDVWPTVRTGDPLSIDVRANDRDPNGDPGDLRVTVFDTELSVAQGNVVLIAPESSTEYTYQVTDAEGFSDTAQIVVEVRNPQPPQAIDDEFGPFKQGDEVVLPVLANDIDPDGDPSALVITAADGGVVPGSGGLQITVPAETASYFYTITDPDGLSSTAVVTVIVVPNQAPQGVPAVFETQFETPIAMDLTAYATDPDGDELIYLCCSSVLGGSPSVNSSGQLSLNVVFTPDAGFSGSAGFSFVAQDPFGTEVSVPVTINVLPQPNRPPTLAGTSTTIEVPRPDGAAVSTTVVLSELADDPDGDQLTYTISAQPGLGLTAAVSASVLTITANASSNPGPATVGISVSDPAGLSASSAVNVMVQPPSNQPPTAGSQTVEIPAGGGTTLNLRSLVTDPDPGEQFTFELSGGGGPGVTATLVGASEVSMLAVITAGGQTADYQYTVDDRLGESATGTLTIRVQPPDKPPPTADPDTAETLQGVTVTIPVLQGDSDPLRKGLKIVSVTQSPDGQATINGDLIVFAPSAAFFGDAEFRYTIGDASELAERQATATVTVNVIGRPDQPSPPNATADSQVADVSWTTPSNNGANITAYEVDRRPAAGAVAPLGVSNSYRWEGLTNGTEYTFRVRAQNEAGWGEWSGWSLPVTPDQEPERPAPPTLTHGDSYLVASWTPPANDGTPIQTYEIRVAGGTPTQVGLLTFQWPNLTNGQEYTFQVRAQNGAGWSEWSAPSAPEHPSKVPSAPVIGTTTRAGLAGAAASGILEANWASVPTSSDGGDPITHYEVEAIGVQTLQADGASVSSKQFGNLPNGQAVQFRVRAFNRDGAGPWSASSSAVVPCAAPEAPRSPSATRGDKQASVSFTAPVSDNGCTITEYRIFDQSSGARVATLSPPNTTATITGLNNGTSYNYTVIALNELGESASSPSTGGVIPAGPPLCGSGSINAIAANVPGRVDLSWTASVDNGRPITTYEIRTDTGSWAPVGASTSFNKTGLQEGTTYNFSYRARNEVGTSGVCGTDQATTIGRPSGVGKPSISLNVDVATVQWSAPANNGAPITSYETQRDGSSAQGNGTSLQRTYPNLADGTTIRVRVRACNVVGCGAWSPYSDSRTVALRSVTLIQGNTAPRPGCMNAPCEDLVVQLSGFSPNESVTIVADATSANGNWCGTWVVTVGGNGAGSFEEHCWWGFHGERVWVLADGVKSNEVVWQ